MSPPFVTLRFVKHADKYRQVLALNDRIKDSIYFRTRAVRVCQPTDVDLTGFQEDLEDKKIEFYPLRERRSFPEAGRFQAGTENPAWASHTVFDSGT